MSISKDSKIINKLKVIVGALPPGEIDEDTLTMAIEDAFEAVDIQIEDSMKDLLLLGLTQDRDLTVAGSVPTVNPRDYDMVVGSGIGSEKIPQIAIESFDGQRVNNNDLLSLAFNLKSQPSGQKRDFIETIYPTYVLPAGSSGILLATQVATIEHPFLRTNAKSDRDKSRVESIVKSALDTESSFGDEKLKLVPVRSTENDTLLYTSETRVDKSTGVDILTSPIKTGVKVPLIAITQTATQLASGVRDNTDALDDGLRLTRLYYTIKDATNTTVHSVNLDGYTSAAWTPSTTGSTKDVGLSLTLDPLILNTTNTKSTDGSASAVLTALSIPNHDIKVSFKVYGSANTEYGDIDSVDSGAITLLSIAKPDGTYMVETDSEYIATKAVIAEMVIVAYDIYATLTNSNVRQVGHMISTKERRALYSIGYQTPLSVSKPQVHASATDNDGAVITSLGKYSKLSSYLTGVKRFLQYVAFLKEHVVNNSVDFGEVSLAAKYYITPYFGSTTIALENYVDGTNSMDSTKNLKGSLISIISERITEMLDASGYYSAHENIETPSDTIDIVVATDIRLHSILTGGEELNIGGDYNVKFICSPVKQMRGKIIIFPTVSSSKPHELSFGAKGMIPTATLEIRRNSNGADVNSLYHQPCYGHLNFLPIATELEVTGLDVVTAKLTQNRRTIT